jgi:geranylgeranyl diphosphate synthase type II
VTAPPADLLAHYRGLALAGVERHLPAGEPRRWLYDPLSAYARRPGKGLRAALCLAACDARGGSEDDAVGAAVAVELAHAACLVHDDIQDGGRVRRGGPAAVVREGLPLALNLGDALAALSVDVLRGAVRRLGGGVAGRVADEFRDAVWRSLEGQATELGWRRDGVTDVTVTDYLSLVLHKTCWYTTIAPLRIGTLIGTRGRTREPDLAALARLGFFLGVAFQVTDDVLNLTATATPGRDGYDKEPGSDLAEGKRTLVLVHLLGAAKPPDRDAVAALLAPGRERSPDDVEFLAGLAGEYGSVDAARAFARGASDAAADAFGVAFRGVSETPGATVVRHLVDHVVERAY